MEAASESIGEATLLGTRVGNFRLVSLLGRGGMGAVYLAEHETIKTRVAIKALLPHACADDHHVQRFFNEAIAVSRIRHTGIAKIFDAGVLPCGRAYLAMEYLDGETLTARIARAGRLPLELVAEIGWQIASVLDATHAAGITHRDLKPDNVFLTPDAELASGVRVKILDFGIAKLSDASVTTASCGAMGTPNYMAPEQWQDARDVDGRADAYALGCLVFEMATGRVPFPAASVGAACKKHLVDAPPRIRALVPELPDELDVLVSRLMEKRPERRPATMREVMHAFAALVSIEPRGAELPIAAAPLASTTVITGMQLGSGLFAVERERRSRPGLLAALGAIGVALLGLLVTSILLLEQGEPSAAAAPQPIAAAPVVQPALSSPAPAAMVQPVAATVRDARCRDDAASIPARPRPMARARVAARHEPSTQAIAHRMPVDPYGDAPVTSEPHPIDPYARPTPSPPGS